MSEFDVLLSAALVLMTYTILYRENSTFKIAQNIFVGSTVGHAIAVAIYQIRDLCIRNIVSGFQMGDIYDIAYIIPLMLGIMLYTQFSSKYRTVSRIPIALMLGVGIALSVRGLIFVNVIGQVRAATISLNSIDNVIWFIGIICSLLYFIYEKKASDIAGPLPKLGRYFIMVTMGAYLANSQMGRLAMVIGTLETLIVPPAWYLIPVAAILIGFDVYIRRKRTQ